MSCAQRNWACVRLRDDFVVLAIDRKNIGAGPCSGTARRKNATGTLSARASASRASGSGDWPPASQREMLELVLLISSASAT